MRKLIYTILGALFLLPSVAWGAESLPYSVNFATESDFETWISVDGDNARAEGPWERIFFQGASFTSSFIEEEDTYFISPEINFSGVGNYKISFSFSATGSIELLLGDDVANLESFNTVLWKIEDESLEDEKVEIPFEIDTPGNYFVAFHVFAPKGNGDYLLKSLSLNSDVATPAIPAIVTNLKASLASDESLKVNLSWTNPDKTTDGKSLEAITKVVINRNGSQIAALTDASYLTPGASLSYEDSPEENGVYKYSIVVSNENGASTDNPMVVESGYVGKPVAEVPYKFVYSSASEDDRAKFTKLDADNDGTNWTAGFTSNSGSFGISNVTDNYLASPYLQLEPGAYMFTSKIAAPFNSVEVGYATNRHNIPETFVKLDVYEGESFSAEDFSVIMEIKEKGDYLLVWHHTGVGNNRTATVSEASLELQPVLPGVVTGLEAQTQVGELNVKLIWTNPSVDMLGQPLESLSKIEIKQNGVVIKTLTEDLVCGEDMSEDLSVDNSGEYTFSVVAYNENGCAKEDAPSVAVFVGTGEKMPYTADFKNWSATDGGTSHFWNFDEEGVASYSKTYGDNDAAIHSPHLVMTSANSYTVSFTTFGKTESDNGEFSLHVGPNSQNMQLVKEFSHSGMDEQHHSVKLQPAEIVTHADGDESVISIPSGNLKLGFHITKPGQVYIRDFKVEAGPSTTGIESVSVDAAQAINCVDGVVSFADGVTDVVVADLAGRVLFKAAQAPVALDLHQFAAKGFLIVTAKTADGANASVKILL